MQHMTQKLSKTAMSIYIVANLYSKLLDFLTRFMKGG